MQSIGVVWIYALIFVGGAIQAWGPPINGTLRSGLSNPWLTGVVVFLPIVAVLFMLWLTMPRPLPTLEGIDKLPWWAPLGGLAGTGAVIAGLLFVDKVGVATYTALTVSANILMSLLVDKFGMFGVQLHELSFGRIAGGALIVAGMLLVSRF